MRMVRLLLVGCVWVGCVWLCGAGPRLEAGPPGLQSWLESPQEWRRDTDGPVLSLGAAGAFDDTHLFAPTAARHGEGVRLWYSGSSGAVDGRLFRLGLAESRDGRTFQKSPRNPLFAFGDGARSVVTPTLLRGPDGVPLREGGRLRLWFSAARLGGGPGTYTIHQTTSADGVRWSAPSPAQLTDARAPAVIRGGRRLSDVVRGRFPNPLERPPRDQRRRGTLDRGRGALSDGRSGVGERPPELSDGPQSRRPVFDVVRQPLDGPRADHGDRLRRQRGRPELAQASPEPGSASGARPPLGVALRQLSDRAATGRRIAADVVREPETAAVRE